MRISNSVRFDCPAYAVDANAKRPARCVQVAALVLGAILCVAIALLSAVALQLSSAGITWTPLG